MSQQYPHDPNQPQQPSQLPQGGLGNTPSNTQGPQFQPAKKRHTVRNVLLILGGVLVLFIGGCTAIIASIGDAANDASKQTSGKAPETVTSTAPVPTAGDSPYDSTEPPAVEETTPPPDDPKVAKVGATEWFTYENGLKVQVTKLARYKIGPYAAGGTPGGSGVVVTVTIRNGSKETADLSLTTINVAYGPNGNQAEEVFDENYGEGFAGSAMPGKAKTTKFAFAVPKGRQALDIEVVPGILDYEAVHFEGSVK